jgi:hypothetical protein
MIPLHVSEMTLMITPLRMAISRQRHARSADRG